MSLEELHGALVLFRGGAGAERSKVPTLATGAFLSGIQPKLSVAEFADHDESPVRV
jgi:hypothetical protein